MNTTIRKGAKLFYGDQRFTHGLSRSGHFTLKEANILEQYGHTLEQLANHTLAPINDEENLFIAHIKQDVAAPCYSAKLWKKYLKTLEKSKVCHSFSSSCERTKPVMDYTYDIAE